MPSFILDTTGNSSANLILDEIHTLTAINLDYYRLIIPNYAPFYVDNFILKHDNGLGVVTTLIENVDYNFCLPYISASRSIGKMLYGGISILNSMLTGTIKVSYQTIGSSWVCDPIYVTEKLAELLYNPRITIWDTITNVQELFPPINHDQSADYIYGYQELITAINNLADVIANGPNTSLPIVQHLLNENNPHNVTKSQLSLDNVANISVASDLEVSNRDLVDKHVTLRQLVSLLSV